MKFCSQCGSIWYLKKTGESELKYVCRTCGNSEDKCEKGICVHSSTINEDYRNFQMLNNKYIIQDPTLPRLNNVKCINSQCLTNQPNLLLVKHVDILDKAQLRTYIWSRISDKLGSESPETDCLKFRPLQSSEVTLYGEIHSLTEHHLMDQEVELHSKLAILECKDSDVYLNVVELLPELSSKISDFYLPETETTSDEISARVIPIEREIIFIKYDDINMKYMYICSTCGSSWKNIS
jgi:DNA-directed RNA polymerase subunit M/transcription elongation factor TFIIS